MRSLRKQVLVLFACLGLLVPVAEASILSVVPMAQRVASGGSFTTAIAISGLGNMTAPSLSTFDLRLSYDPTKLSYQSVTFGDPTLGDQLDLAMLGSFTDLTEGSGFVRLFQLSFDTPSDLVNLQAGDFVLAQVRFSAIGGGTSALTLSDVTLGDENGAALIPTLVGGSVTVPEPTTVALLASALLALGVTRRRRRADTCAIQVALALCLIGVDLRSGYAQNSCPEATPTYLSQCGPPFVLPRWPDNSPQNWDQPSSYTTIQLGNVDGKPGNELVARSALGVYLEKFDTTRGQWITQVANANGAVLGLTDAAGWNSPQYYSTIKLADVDGDGQAELVARSTDGLIVFHYSTSATSPGWTQLTLTGPFSDAAGFHPAPYYLTIRYGNIDANPQGTLSVIGRGPLGLYTYRYDSTSMQWTQLGPVLADLSDQNGWSSPQYYSTIQLADLDGDGATELLARAPEGVLVYRFNANTNTWTKLTPVGPFSDPDGSGSDPAYYSTIHFANIDGTPGAEMIGRAPAGLLTYKWIHAANAWETLGTLTAVSDGQGWNAPQYYQTLQLADVDRLTGAELLGRGPSGMLTWKWNAGSSAWVLIPQAANSPQLIDGPNPASDVNSWANAQYYATIQTGDVDGDGSAELLARGPYGIRTWRFDTPSQSWRPYLVYGFPDVVNPGSAGFSSQALQSAYVAVNRYLGLTVDTDTVRMHYTDAASTVGDYKSCLSDWSPGATFPAVPTSDCTQSGIKVPSVPQSDWNTVAGQIYGELQWALLVAGHFGTLSTMYSTLWGDTPADFATIIPGLVPSTTLNSGATANFNYVSMLTGVGAGIATLAAGPLGGAAFGFVMDIFTADWNSVPDFAISQATSVFNQTLSEVQSQMATLQQSMEDQASTNWSYVSADPGLLSAVAYIAPNFWNLNANVTTGFRSAGRYQFTKWIYQSFLPAIWANYQVWNCVNVNDINNRNVMHCVPPPPIPLPSPEVGSVFGPYISSISGPDFSGILYVTSGCTQEENSYPVSCEWDLPEWAPPPAKPPPKPPPPTIVAQIWGAIAQDCTYDAISVKNPWHYGCSLGVGDEIFNNQDGWNFTNYACDMSTAVNCPTSGTSAVMGIARSVGTSQGSVELFTTKLVSTGLNLANAAVTIDFLLYEGNGAGELVSTRVPLQLVRIGLSSGRMQFASAAGSQPQVQMLLALNGGILEARLTAQGATLFAPELCESHGTTVLRTVIRVTDGVNPNVSFGLPLPWECVEGAGGSVATLRRQAFGAQPGDLSGDGRVDKRDLSLLNSDLNKTVAQSLCGSACDLDGDGRITALDARKLVLACTKQGCALQ